MRRKARPSLSLRMPARPMMELRLKLATTSKLLLLLQARLKVADRHAVVRLKLQCLPLPLRPPLLLHPCRRLPQPLRQSPQAVGSPLPARVAQVHRAAGEEEMEDEKVAVVEVQVALLHLPNSPYTARWRTPVSDIRSVR